MTNRETQIKTTDASSYHSQMPINNKEIANIVEGSGKRAILYTAPCNVNYSHYRNTSVLK